MSGTGDRLLWAAVDQWSDQPVLLTRVPTSSEPEPRRVAIRRTVAREVGVATGIRNEHLAQVLDVVVDGDGEVWVASDVPSPARTLREVLDESGPVTRPRLTRWTRELADALAALHDHGLAHRDVRPERVAVHGDDSASLLAVGADPGAGLIRGGAASETGGDVRSLAAMARAALTRAGAPTVDGDGLAVLLDLAGSDAGLTAAELRDRLSTAVAAVPGAGEATIAERRSGEPSTVRVPRSPELGGRRLPPRPPGPGHDPRPPALPPRSPSPPPAPPPAPPSAPPVRPPAGLPAGPVPTLDSARPMAPWAGQDRVGRFGMVAVLVVVVVMGVLGVVAAVGTSDPFAESSSPSAIRGPSTPAGC